MTHGCAGSSGPGLYVQLICDHDYVRYVCDSLICLVVPAALWRASYSFHFVGSLLEPEK